jgi:hypothetical protein
MDALLISERVRILRPDDAGYAPNQAAIELLKLAEDGEIENAAVIYETPAGQLDVLLTTMAPAEVMQLSVFLSAFALRLAERSDIDRCSDEDDEDDSPLPA